MRFGKPMRDVLPNLEMSKLDFRLSVIWDLKVKVGGNEIKVPVGSFEKRI